MALDHGHHCGNSQHMGEEEKDNKGMTRDREPK